MTGLSMFIDETLPILLDSDPLLNSFTKEVGLR